MKNESTELVKYKNPLLHVYESYLLYPILYKDLSNFEDIRFSVFHHMFVVVGNGFEWYNTEKGLISDSTSSMIINNDSIDYEAKLAERFHKLLDYINKLRKASKPLNIISKKIKYDDNGNYQLDPLTNNFILGFDDINDLDDVLKERVNDFLNLNHREYKKKYNLSDFNIYLKDIIKCYRLEYKSEDNNKHFLYPASNDFILSSLKEERYKYIAPEYKKIILEHLELIKDAYTDKKYNNIIKNIIKSVSK